MFEKPPRLLFDSQSSTKETGFQLSYLPVGSTLSYFSNMLSQRFACLRVEEDYPTEAFQDVTDEQVVIKVVHLWVRLRTPYVHTALAGGNLRGCGTLGEPVGHLSVLLRYEWFLSQVQVDPPILVRNRNAVALPDYLHFRELFAQPTRGHINIEIATLLKEGNGLVGGRGH